MRLSQLIGKRFKERPSEAVMESHAFLLRGGYIRQVANGLYSLLPLGLRVKRKIEAIIREEMNRIGGQEVLLPLVNPREIWEESGRYGTIDAELVRFKDRTGHDMVLAMTHEEAAVQLARQETDTYRSYPFMLYQVQSKFRDEPRSRGGLIRLREFTMKDAYSFHTDQEDLDRFYAVCADAYERIFARCGLPEVRQVRSDSGMMGGRVAHEFMLLTETGEDTIVSCPKCGYIANREAAESVREYAAGKPLPLEKVYTPGIKTIEEVSAFLAIAPEQTAKAVFYEADAEGRPVIALIRGDLAVNETKLAGILKTAPVPASPATVAATGAVAGYASPMGLKGVRVIADLSVARSANLVCGANEADFHMRNFNLERDADAHETADIALAREGEGCVSCGEKLAFRRGIEMGNIFQLGTRYTDKMGMRFIDRDGNERVPLMGCYGIGIERILAAAVEAHHDGFGPLWPVSLAPFQVQIVTIDLSAQRQEDFAAPIYGTLRAQGLEVAYDDRDERPGVKFADADLIGAPLRLICSSRNYGPQMVEWKARDKSGQGILRRDEVADFAAHWISTQGK
jgi:prolyl-tRNA synthetase